MPGMDGLAVCRRLRAKGMTAPVLMLTARDAVPDRVRGLEAGADDYLVKPFAPEELVARIRALTRRGAPAERAAASPTSRSTWRRTRRTRGERSIELSGREAAAARAAAARPAQRASRGSARSSRSGTTRRCPTWSTATSGGCARKLGDPPLIHTVRGVGFMLRDVRPRTFRARLVAASLGCDPGRAGPRGRRAARSPRRSCAPRSTGRSSSGRATSPACASRRPPCSTRRARSTRRAAGARSWSRCSTAAAGSWPARSRWARAPAARTRVVAARAGRARRLRRPASSPAGRCASTRRRSPDTGGSAAGGAVLVASDTSDIERTLHRSRVLLLFAALGAAVLAGVAAAAAHAPRAPAAAAS